MLQVLTLDFYHSVLYHVKNLTEKHDTQAVFYVIQYDMIFWKYMMPFICLIQLPIQSIAFVHLNNSRPLLRFCGRRFCRRLDSSGCLSVPGLL